MILLALDPGLRRSGVALFDAGQLVAAAAPTVPAGATVPTRVRNMAAAVTRFARERYKLDGHWLSQIAVEWPQVYQRGAGRSKGDPNDLLPLAAVVGAVLVALPEAVDVTNYDPDEWKGQVPKDVMRGRVEGALSPAERGLCHKLPHDGWDAVGLGLVHLGRLGRGGVRR